MHYYFLIWIHIGLCISLQDRQGAQTISYSLYCRCLLERNPLVVKNKTMYWRIRAATNIQFAQIFIRILVFRLHLFAFGIYDMVQITHACRAHIRRM